MRRFPGSFSQRGAAWKLVLALVAAVALTAVSATQLAAHLLQRQLLALLGDESAVGAVHVGWAEVLIKDLQITAPKGWPVKDALRAERVRIVPDFRSLFSDSIQVDRIVFEHAYVSVLRARDSRLRLLPSLLEHEDSAADAAPASRISIGTIEVQDAVIDLYDASVRPQIVNLRIEAVHGELNELLIPSLQGRSHFDAAGTIRSGQRDGEVKVKGWLAFATRESDIQLVLRNVDMVAVEPYLIRDEETGVERGRVDLEMRSEVRDRRLHAPGTLVLTDMKLKSEASLLGSFMGVPRNAVLASLKSGRDETRLRFTLEGDIDDPKFSLNETLSVRFAVGLAAALGVGVVDFVKDVGTLGGRGLKATGEAIGELFGVDKDDEEQEADTPSHERSAPEN